MAEFCFECLNEMLDYEEKKEDYVLSRQLDLCEGCGEMKRVVVRHRRCLRMSFLYRMLRLLFIRP